MARYKVVLAYDGTDFAGFQRQKNFQTVQGEVERSLRKLGWEGKSILAAGRTDSGVHARGQVVAFDLEWVHSDLDLQNALNSHLPSSISARSVGITHIAFRPRNDATARLYRYTLLQDPVRQPLLERYAWRVWPELELGPMQEGASFLLGQHNFAAFGSPHIVGGSTERSVHRAEWKKAEKGLQFEITGNAFLYHMVRRIVFALTTIGQNRHQPGLIYEQLRIPDPNQIPGLAPARGLCLMEVIYSEPPPGSDQ